MEVGDRVYLTARGAERKNMPVGRSGIVRKTNNISTNVEFDGSGWERSVFTWDLTTNPDHINNLISVGSRVYLTKLGSEQARFGEIRSELPADLGGYLRRIINDTTVYVVFDGCEGVEYLVNIWYLSAHPFGTAPLQLSRGKTRFDYINDW